MEHVQDSRDKGHWYDVFHRKRGKKKIYKELIESNNRLVAALADQSHRTTSLSFKNEELSRQLKTTEDRLSETTEAKKKLKAKNTAVKETLADMKAKLEETERTTKANMADFEDRNRKLTCEKDHMTKKLYEIGRQIEIYQDKVEQLRIENARLVEAREKLNKELLSAEKLALEESLKHKLLDKEFQCNFERLSQVVEEKEKLQGLVMELRKLLFVLKKEKLELQHELVAQNEFLSLQTDMLTRALQKTQAKMANVQEDKLSLISYFQDKLQARSLPSATRHLGQITEHSGEHAPDKPRLVLMPDYPNIEYLKNKVFNLEAQLYRQAQLISELTDIIVNFDPAFSLHRHPHLNVYIDNTQGSPDYRHMPLEVTEDVTEEPTLPSNGLTDEAFNFTANEAETPAEVDECGSDSTLVSLNLDDVLDYVSSSSSDLAISTLWETA